MKIYYDKIDQEKLDLSANFTFYENEEHYQIDRFDGELYKVDGSYFLRGDMEVTLECPCDRCLEKGTIKYSVNINVGIEPGDMGSKLTKEYEMNDEDGEVYYTEPDFLDLNDLLRQEALLQVPAKKLCSPDCKGLNIEDKVDEDKSSNIFSVLKTLEEKYNGGSKDKNNKN